MKTFLLFLTVTFALAVIVGGKDKTPEKGADTTMLQAVIHVNFADPERQEDAMGNIENILIAVPAAHLEVVCHGKGINLLLTKESKHFDKLEALMKQGVQFVACENTLKKRALEKDALMPGVTTVASGAVEVIRKQHEGYGYFRP